MWHGHNGRLDPVLTIPFPDSVGHFYSEFTEFLGFQRNSDEWKVMGLAPYGKPGVNLSAFMDVNAAPYRVHARQLFANGATSSAGMAALLARRVFQKAASTNVTKTLLMPCRMLAKRR